MKPKLLIIGHARHGKDTVGERISKTMGLSFMSSSEFVGREAIWPMWGEERYCSFDEMFEDRVNYRSTWKDLISAYNTPDKSRTATEMLFKHNLYVGMRARDELEACKTKDLFDYIIWVDGSQRHPPEGKGSMELVAADADLHIDNNGPEHLLDIAIYNLQKRLYSEGFAVNYVPAPKLNIDIPVPRFHDRGAKLPMLMPLSHDNEETEAKPFRMLTDNEKWTDKLPNNEKWNDMPRAWEDMPEHAKQVLDHGFFKVLEVMGTDHSICEAARMSYGRGTKKTSPDQDLINYLVRNGHTSPLEMGEIKVHMRLPIFVMRQWVRHRTANLNEYSGRYSEMVRLFYIPEPEQICLQDKVNKQGSAEPMSEPNAMMVRKIMTLASDRAFDDYEQLLRLGVSRETARIILPLNTFTEVVWKLDVSNLIKFLKLRDDDHAQWEIRQYAKLVSETVERFFPLVFFAYQESRHSRTFTSKELEALVTGHTEALSKSQLKKIEQIRDNLL